MMAFQWQVLINLLTYIVTRTGKRNEPQAHSRRAFVRYFKRVLCAAVVAYTHHLKTLAKAQYGRFTQKRMARL